LIIVIEENKTFEEKREKRIELGIINSRNSQLKE